MTNEVAKEIIARLKARYDDLVNEYEIWDSYTQGFCEAFDLVEGILNNTSNADASEVKHGEWKCYSDMVDVRCNLCGKFANQATDFCPHCGAKMDGDEND